MHKHISARVVAAAVIFIIALLGVNWVGANDVNSWVSSSLSLVKQADTQSLPPTLHDNIDCETQDALNCTVPTPYGSASANSAIKFSSSSKLLPVITYVDNRQHFFPIPNSSTFMSIYSGPVYGLNVAFNYNFTSSVTKVGDLFQVSRPPDGKLADKTNHQLPADTLSMGFSPNGRWMVVSDPNVAMLRVNLDTFEVLPFAPGFNYTIGLDPAVKTAVTNDGRYAVVASNNFATFKIYDLDTCGPVPAAITGPVTCQSRDLRGYMQQQDANFNMVLNARFLNDNALSFYGSYKSGATNKTSRYVISDNGPSSQIQYLALGESYISGEGAFNYQGGTDTASNKCHLSFLAYPYLIGQDLNYDSYHSVACSGAKTDDITNTSDSYAGQADDKKIKRSDRTPAQIDSFLASFTPGYIDQLDFVSKYQPKVINLSIGGNDMGFTGILKKCITPSVSNNTCYSTYEDRLELVRQINNHVFPALQKTYHQIKNTGPPDMRIYVIGYPQIAKPGGDCALNVHLNADEILFAQELINYLDTVIQVAAAQSGVYYVDTQDALNGFRLCEAGPGAVAVNGLTAGNDTPKLLSGPIGNESYHPNATGYQLLENKILSATHNLTTPMPAPNSSILLPSENTLVILNSAHSGRAINVTEFDPDMTADVTYKQTPLAVAITGSLHALPAAATLKAELHSDPISLGSFKTDSTGNLSVQITIPSTVPAGYHSLHFYGNDLVGQPIDIYKDMYVAQSTDDLDGDGVADSSQKCVGVTVSGQDFDKDGIDDACDANITQPPPNPPPTKQSDPAESNPNPALGNQPPDLSISITSSAIILTQNNQPMTIETAADILPPGIDTSAILNDKTSSKILANAQPQVLGAATEKPKSKLTPIIAAPINNGQYQEYLFAGLIILVSGFSGLILKLRQQ